uniref:Uncharacterized protein n=1 Tax=Anguilla anguilla TaxID=7936 RepID=A0A0E9U5Z1_ANGAN
MVLPVSADHRRHRCGVEFEKRKRWNLRNGRGGVRETEGVQFEKRKGAV